MRTCERCKEPLVDDRAGHSADGRLVCTRTGCQFVEEINRRVADGRLTLVPADQCATKIEFPTNVKWDPRITLETEIHAVLVKPLPEGGLPPAPKEASE